MRNLSIFEKAKRDWIVNARSVAIKLMRKTGRPITINDVTKVLPLPKELHHNTIGSVFREGPDFHLVGYIKSYKPSARHRVVGLWIEQEDNYGRY